MSERLNQLILATYDKKNNQLKGIKGTDSNKKIGVVHVNNIKPSNISSNEENQKSSDISLRRLHNHKAEGFRIIKNSLQNSLNDENSKLRAINITSFQLKKIWEATCNYIQNELLNGRAVAVPHFGIFTFYTEKEDCGEHLRKTRTPVFMLFEDFRNKYGVTSIKLAINESARKISLNTLSNQCKCSKDTIRTVIETIIDSVGSQAQSSRNKEYSINFLVCKIIFKGKHCQCQWNKSFLIALSNNSIEETEINTKPKHPLLERGEYANARRNRKILESLESSNVGTGKVNNSTEQKTKEKKSLSLDDALNVGSVPPSNKTKSPPIKLMLGPPYDIDKITSVTSHSYKSHSTNSQQELFASIHNNNDLVAPKIGNPIPNEFYVQSGENLLNTRPLTPKNNHRIKGEELMKTWDLQRREHLTSIEKEKRDKSKEKKLVDAVVAKTIELELEKRKEKYQQDLENLHYNSIKALKDEERSKRSNIEIINEKEQNIKYCNALSKSITDSFSSRRRKKQAYGKVLRDQIDSITSKYSDKGSEIDNNQDNYLSSKILIPGEKQDLCKEEKRELQKLQLSELEKQIEEKRLINENKQLEDKQFTNMIIIPGNDMEFAKSKEETKNKLRQEYYSFVESRNNEMRESKSRQQQEEKKDNLKHAQTLIAIGDSYWKKKKQNRVDFTHSLDQQLSEKQHIRSNHRKIEQRRLFSSLSSNR
ncbi:hypothetical protein ABK040_001806 [Willaertia magna]